MRGDERYVACRAAELPRAVEAARMDVEAATADDAACAVERSGNRHARVLVRVDLAIGRLAEAGRIERQDVTRIKETRVDDVLRHREREVMSRTDRGVPGTIEMRGTDDGVPGGHHRRGLGKRAIDIRVHVTSGLDTTCQRRRTGGKEQVVACVQRTVRCDRPRAQRQVATRMGRAGLIDARSEDVQRAVGIDVTAERHRLCGVEHRVAGCIDRTG